MNCWTPQEAKPQEWGVSKKGIGEAGHYLHAMGEKDFPKRKHGPLKMKNGCWAARK